MSFSNVDTEIETAEPLKVFTLAHAVRPKKSLCVSNEKTYGLLPDMTITQQIKETSKKKHCITIRRQPRSRLRTRIIVSKMATRKPITIESEDPLENLDLSKYRNYKLSPPIWLDKMYQTRRNQPSNLEKMIKSMKEKCLPFDSNFQHNPIAPTGGMQQHCDLAQSTTNLEHYYNQLYRNHKFKENTPPADLEEDPLESETIDFSSSYNNVELEANVSTVSKKVEFVWNPVIVTQKQPSSILQRTSVQNAYWSPFCGDTPRWQTDTFHNRIEQPSFSPFSSSNNISDTSSTSSGLTIAEERLQLKYYMKNMPRQSKYPTERRSNRSSFFEFLER